MKPLFIVFEGIDGSGKGTIIKETKSFLLQNGVSQKDIFVTAEPTNGFYGKKVRELLKTSPKPELNAPQFLDLYVADRKEHIEKELLPALKENKIILCDRYKYSTFVYQALQGIPVEKIKKLHEGMPVPDLIFILDVPAKTALERISKRKQLDSFEKKDFLEKVRNGFLSLKEIFPEENIHIVDASKSIKEVKKQITYWLNQFL
ncbi:MAG TPA: dTMP kinase [archaeon]|nr:dTMP kinase [archaeon]